MSSPFHTDNFNSFHYDLKMLTWWFAFRIHQSIKWCQTRRPFSTYITLSIMPLRTVTCGVCILDILQLVNYSTSKISLLNLRYSNFLSKTMPMTDLVTKLEMQALKDDLSCFYKASFKITICLDKTVVMFQPTPGSPYIEQSYLWTTTN